MLYPDKPELQGYTPIWVTYGNMWVGSTGEGQDKWIDEDYVRSTYIPSVPQGMEIVCLDVEHYEKTGPNLPDTIMKLNRILEIWKEERPEIKLGYYSLMIRDYWRAISNDPVQIAAWKAENDALQPVIQNTDIQFPSVYTFYDDEAGNDEYIRMNLEEQKRLTPTPMYPFIWPQYHNSNQTLGNQQIPGSYWNKILDRVFREDTQGLVVWGWRFLPPDQTWAARADWWPTQEAFRGSRP